MPENVEEIEGFLFELLAGGELRGTVLRDRMDLKLGRQVRRHFFYATLARLEREGKVATRKENNAWRKTTFYSLAKTAVAKKKAKK